MQFGMEALERRALLSGEFDTSFAGGSGVLNTSLNSYSSSLTAVTTDRYGQIFGLGKRDNANVVASFTSAGDFTSPFGGLDYAEIPFSGFTPTSLAVSASGKIYIGGSEITPAAGTRMAVVALNADGTPDTTFDGDGLWTGLWRSSPNAQNEVNGIAFFAGNIYIGGGDHLFFGVARLTTQGTLDTTFGGQGTGMSVVTGANGASDPAAFVLATPLTSPPFLAVAGTAGSNAAVFRWDTNGNELAGSGFPFSPSVGTLYPTALAADGQGRIYVAGQAGQQAVVTRLNSSGYVDGNYGSSGTYLYPVAEKTQFVRALAVDASGQALISVPPIGNRPNDGDTLVALSDQGSKNLTFAGLPYGELLTDGRIRSMLTQADGKILLAGDKPYQNGDYSDLQLSRLNALPATTKISGYLFNDINGDGVNNDGGATANYGGLAAYLDLNNNGTFDTATEPSAYAGSGKFSFDNVAPNTVYTVRLHVPESISAHQTYPYSNLGVVVQTKSGVDNTVGPFGVQFTRLYTVVGYAFTDWNSDGVKQSGEPFAGGRTIYDDANNNGKYDAGEISTVTYTNGFFTLGLTAGNHTVRQVLPFAAVETGRYMATTYNGASFAANGVVRVPADTAGNTLYFGSHPAAVATVYDFNDANANGTKDAGEAYLDVGGVGQGGIVYIDVANNGVFDNGIDIVATASTDLNGLFYLQPGNYAVRQKLDAGWEATTPMQVLNVGTTTQTLTILNGRRQTPTTPKTFTVKGSVFIDTNKNGKRDGTEGEQGELGGWYAFVDTNNSGGLDDADFYAAATGFGIYNPYTLTLPADGKTYRVQLRNDDTATRTFTTAGYFDIASSTNGQVVTGRDFGLTPIAPGAGVSGSVYSDVNKNAKRDATEAGLANQTVYIDVDNDKVLDAGELWTTTDAAGAFAFANVPNTGSATRLRVILPAGVTQTSPVNGNGYGLTLTAGANNTAKTFGLYSAPVVTTGTLSGTSFDDTNKNGLFDAGESKTAGKTVFLDLDGDNVLDSNEKKTTTASDGSWSFSGLVAGTYHVRRVFPAGYTLSTTPIDVNLAAGQVVSGLLIGSKSGTATPTNTASVSGFAFDDKNKNGVYDAGDALAAGKTIWLDLDDDNVKDSNETSVVSAADGGFAFKNLAAGTYHVRRLFPSGYLESTPARYITLTNGQAGAGVSVGSKAK